MDWAQEIATKFVGVYRETSLIDEKKWVDGIAAAIRHAKAQGMREAAKECGDAAKNPSRFQVERDLHSRASQIEKGNR